MDDVHKHHDCPHFACRVKAITADTSGAEALVPVKPSVQSFSHC